jgi:predicted Kef-type K+ transport protein
LDAATVQLSVVGQRGVVVALLGSMLPLGMGTALAAGVFSMNIKSALAVGASLAPTSMGISLKVLEEGKVLSTPTGQLIIAAAVIDDVIALVLLAQVRSPVASAAAVPLCLFGFQHDSSPATTTKALALSVCVPHKAASLRKSFPGLSRDCHNCGHSAKPSLA